MQEKTMQTSSATTVNTNIPKSYRTFLGVEQIVRTQKTSSLSVVNKFSDLH